MNLSETTAVEESDPHFPTNLEDEALAPPALLEVLTPAAQPAAERCRR